MSKVLFANGNTGLVSIHNGNADINNPLNNLNNIFFHSNLNYLSIVSVISGSIWLPQRVSNASYHSAAYGSTTYNLGSHNLGYTPLVFGINPNNGQSLVGDVVIQAAGQCSIRTLTIGADNHNIFMREIFLNKDVTFSGLSLGYTLYIFNSNAA